MQIPHAEHRALHLTIFSRLENLFVKGILETYWEAYEAGRLMRYQDYAELQKLWSYHAQIVRAILNNDHARGKELLLEHMQLLPAPKNLVSQDARAVLEDAEENGHYINEMFGD